MKYLFATVLFSLVLFPAISASASTYNDYKCDCVSTSDLPCACNYSYDLSNSGTKEFRAYCTTSDSGAQLPMLAITGLKNGTTCTLSAASWGRNNRYISRSCTNWDPFHNDTLDLKVQCYCTEPTCPPPLADTEASLSKQQLPVPAGGVSECLTTAQQGTILSNSLANVEWQGDGNLVVYQNGSRIWASNTRGNADKLCFSDEGNLIIYNNNSPTWNAGTSPYGQTLKLQTDCNLVISDSGDNYKWGSQALCR